MSEKNDPGKLIAQWITSLAISVICCAILFDVFAGYLMDIRSTSNLTIIRVENLQEKIRQLTTDLTALQRQQAASNPKDNAPVAPPSPPSAGVDLSDPTLTEPQDAGKAEAAPPPASAPSAAPVKAKPQPAPHPDGQAPNQQQTP